MKGFYKMSQFVACLEKLENLPKPSIQVSSSTSAPLDRAMLPSSPQTLASQLHSLPRLPASSRFLDSLPFYFIPLILQFRKRRAWKVQKYIHDREVATYTPVSHLQFPIPTKS